MAEEPKPVTSIAPPVQAYAAYPRGVATPIVHGSPDQLQALMEGYYGLNWAFLAYFGLAIASFIVLVVSQASLTGVVLFIVLFVSGLAAMALIAHPCHKKIGFGLNWRESTPLLVTIGLVVGSLVVSPIIAFIIIQLIAMAEIKNYGVKSGLFGVRKKDIVARIAELRQQSPLGQIVPGFQAKDFREDS